MSVENEPVADKDERTPRIAPIRMDIPASAFSARWTIGAHR